MLFVFYILFGIRYAVTFVAHHYLRTRDHPLPQLTKPQLLSVLPLLSQHLAYDNYVICTYVAITIDRILSMRQGNALL